jgi:hypothetical protein
MYLSNKSKQVISVGYKRSHFRINKRRSTVAMREMPPPTAQHEFFLRVRDLVEDLAGMLKREVLVCRVNRASTFTPFSPWTIKIGQLLMLPSKGISSQTRGAEYHSAQRSNTLA